MKNIIKKSICMSKTRKKLLLNSTLFEIFVAVVQFFGGGFILHHHHLGKDTVKQRPTVCHLIREIPPV